MSKQMGHKEKTQVIQLMLDYGVTLDEARMAFTMGKDLHSDILCQLINLGLPHKSIHAISAQIWLEYHKVQNLADKLGVHFDEKVFRDGISEEIESLLARLSGGGSSNE